jgi:hypothetical protein
LRALPYVFLGVLVATYADIATRVQAILVSPTDACLAAIPRFVEEGQRAGEGRHGFLAMEGEVWLAPGLGSTSLELAAVFPVRGSYLRRRVGFDPSIMKLTLEYSETFLASKVRAANTSNGDWLLDLVPWPSGSFNASIRANRIAYLLYWGIFAQVLRVDRQPGVSNNTMLLRCEETLINTGTIADEFSYRQFTAESFPMEWSVEDGTELYFGANTQNGRPNELREMQVSIVTTASTPSFVGNRTFECLPPSDLRSYKDGDNYDGPFYLVRLPCYLSLGDGLTWGADHVPGHQQTWWTIAASEYLEAYAAAEAFAFDEDFVKAEFWRGKAETELSKLIREDKQARVRTRAMKWSGDHYPQRSRKPDWRL